MRWIRPEPSADEHVPDTERLTPLEERFMTARKYAKNLTEVGAICDRAEGKRRFCVWQATELDFEYDDLPAVAVRCRRHPGGRYRDHTQKNEIADPGA